MYCNSGRMPVQKGFDVCGIDLSPKSIFEADKSSNDKLEFFVHDMRRMFRTNYFDCVVNLFTSFGYFEKESENLLSVQNISKALKPDGLLVLDYLNTQKASCNLRSTEEIWIHDIRFSIKKSIRNSFIVKEISFRDGDEDFHFVEKVALLELEHFEKYFLDSGLKLLNLYGNYQLESFDPAHSDRLIMTAVKI
jgi:SAM-dependent methyltransferase